MNPTDRHGARRGGSRRTGTPVCIAACLVLLSSLTPTSSAAQDEGASELEPDPLGCFVNDSTPVPAEVEPFVQPGTHAACVAPADLNGDGLGDYVLVLERPGKRDPGSVMRNAERSLRIVVRQPGGGLREAARNDHVVYCSQCGGIFGDPFEGVAAGPGTFTVYHYGGSAWRWRADYTFRYLPSAGTWRLSKVVELSYHTGDPNKMTQTLFIAPDDFGEIDLARFHPERWKRPPDRR